MSDECTCNLCLGLEEPKMELPEFTRRCDKCQNGPVEWLYVATRDAEFLCKLCALRELKEK